MASTRTTAEEIERWRRKPVVVGGETLSVSFLKHSDDQTVAAMGTLLRLLDEQGWHDRCFGDWGVIAAPNFFARINIAACVRKYQQDGAWGVSPHRIPHQSLHAISGTVSQALKIHGPNFGVSGGPNAGPDAFLLAAALLADGRLPGLWLILTGYDAEVIPGEDEHSTVMPTCHAVVMALTRSEETTTGLHVSIGSTSAAETRNHPLAVLPMFQSSTLSEPLPRRENSPGSRWRLSDTHWIEWHMDTTDQEEHA